MLGAINRLMLIIAATLGVCALGVVFVRWLGTQQQFAEPPHSWFQQRQWTVTKVDPCAEPLDVIPERMLWLRVHYTASGWSACDQEFKSVSAAIQQFPTASNWLLFVDSKETTNLDKLIAEIEPLKKELGIYTPSQIAARYLRKKAPQWVYGADAATLLRLHLFTSFWIETAFDFWPDFVIQQAGDKNTDLSPRELSELQRRKKRVIQHP